MKKTIVTVVFELEETNHDMVKHLISEIVSDQMHINEFYSIVEIEDIEE